MIVRDGYTEYCEGGIDVIEFDVHCTVCGWIGYKVAGYYEHRQFCPYCAAKQKLKDNLMIESYASNEIVIKI